MPYVVEKLPSKNRAKPYYRVTIRGTNRIVAKATPDPNKVIAAIELNKKRMQKKAKK